MGPASISPPLELDPLDPDPLDPDPLDPDPLDDPFGSSPGSNTSTTGGLSVRLVSSDSSAQPSGARPITTASTADIEEIFMTTDFFPGTSWPGIVRPPWYHRQGLEAGVRILKERGSTMTEAGAPSTEIGISSPEITST